MLLVYKEQEQHLQNLQLHKLNFNNKIKQLRRETHFLAKAAASKLKTNRCETLSKDNIPLRRKEHVKIIIHIN